MEKIKEKIFWIKNVSMMELNLEMIFIIQQFLLFQHLTQVVLVEDKVKQYINFIHIKIVLERVQFHLTIDIIQEIIQLGVLFMLIIALLHSQFLKINFLIDVQKLENLIHFVL